jgi:hypothetical protein
MAPRKAQGWAQDRLSHRFFIAAGNGAAAPKVNIRGAAGNRERLDLTRFWLGPFAQNRELFCDAT